MSAYDNVIGGKLKLKGKALDVKAGGVKKKKKKHKKQEEQALKVTEHDLIEGDITIWEQSTPLRKRIAFTTQESGNYLVCFTADPKSHGNKNVSINLDWKTGIAAKDWAAIAKKDKIEGVELEIKKLEGAVEAIHENIIYLRHREAEMRDVSEKTNSRVTLYSVISLGICIAVSGTCRVSVLGGERSLIANLSAAN